MYLERGYCEAMGIDMKPLFYDTSDMYYEIIVETQSVLHPVVIVT